MRARGPGFTVRAVAGFLRRTGFLRPRAVDFDFALADFFFGLGFFLLVGFFLAMKKVYHLEAMSTTQAVSREPRGEFPEFQRLLPSPSIRFGRSQNAQV